MKRNISDTIQAIFKIRSEDIMQDYKFGTLAKMEEMASKCGSSGRGAKKELYDFCIENMEQDVFHELQVPLRFNQTSFPFCQFNFVQQSQLYQEYYRCYMKNNNLYFAACLRPLIYDMVLDYVKNGIPDVSVSSGNRLYLTALQEAAEYYIRDFEALKSCNYGRRFTGIEERITADILSDQRIIDYLKSIGCLEFTILNAPPNYSCVIGMKTPDFYVQELCKLGSIIETMCDIRSRGHDFTTYECSGMFAETGVIPCETSITSMPGFARRSLPDGNMGKLSDNLKNAIERDDVASFMIDMQIHGKRVSNTIFDILTIKGKIKILNELMRKRPGDCKNIAFLLLGGNFSWETRIGLLKTLEEMRPGTMKETMDAKGQNPLWYAFALTNELGELEQFLLSSGCDPENKMMGLSYRRFRELYLQLKLKIEKWGIKVGDNNDGDI